MAADAGTKQIPPLICEPLAPLLRERLPRGRSVRQNRAPRPGEAQLEGLFPASRIAPATVARRARIIMAGCRNTGSGALEALDRIAARLSAQIFILHEMPSPPVMLEQVQDLPPLKASAARDLLARACAFLCLSDDDAEDPFLASAAKSGCPLVLIDTPIMRARWEGAAVFVRLDETGACAQALRRMIEDPEHRQRMALAAARRAQDMKPASKPERVRKPALATPNLTMLV